MISFAIIFSQSAFRLTAFARGCSLLFSSEKAIVNSSSSLLLSAGIISVTFGSPSVIVPVLSRATICTLPVSSSDTAVLKRIPFFAATELPTIIATGVARPSAQGQLMTRTAIPLAKAKPIFCPRTSQAITVNTEIKITVGTNTPETLSAILAIGAFVDAASLTI